jgi:hypothetical protein
VGWGRRGNPPVGGWGFGLGVGLAAERAEFTAQGHPMGQSPPDQLLQSRCAGLALVLLARGETWREGSLGQLSSVRRSEGRHSPTVAGLQVSKCQVEAGLFKTCFNVIILFIW